MNTKMPSAEAWERDSRNPHNDETAGRSLLQSLEPSLWNSKIGRRAFVKKTGAATVGTAIALHGFRTEVLATVSNAIILEDGDICVGFWETWYEKDMDLINAYTSSNQHAIPFIGDTYTSGVGEQNIVTGTKFEDFVPPATMVINGVTYTDSGQWYYSSGNVARAGNPASPSQYAPSGMVRHRTGDVAPAGWEGDFIVSDAWLEARDINTYDWSASRVYNRVN